jgi:hypothetical protein
MSDDWNINLVNQTIKTTWHRANANADEIKQLRHVTIEALVGVAPKDQLEGMLTAQLVACHNASMECYRAMICEQTFEGRRENLTQANKPLDRHSRRSRWSTSTSTKAARPLSATLRVGGEGSHRKQRNNPMHLPMHHAPRCGARTLCGSLCQSPAMTNGRCRMHGGTSPGAPKGNKNALKHGRHTADAIARRRSIAQLIRTARQLGM